MAKKQRAATTRPTGRTTAYSFFQKNYLKKDRRIVDKCKLLYKCACAWQSMSYEEKLPWLKMEAYDIERYEREMTIWKQMNPPQGTSKRHIRSVPKKATKPSNAPKHPLSAFFWWGYSIRPDVTKAHPGKGVCAISKILGEMWKHVELDVRLKFEIMAEKDKLRYRREKKEYLKTIENQ